MMSWKRWNYFFCTLFITVVLLISVIGEYMLFRLNENLSIMQSITTQLKDNSIYGRYLIGQQELYKQEMTIIQKPDIIAVGSSRVMMFRKEFFREDVHFYNAGGSVPSIQHGIEFINEVIKHYNPKVVILGVDMWWLNEDYIEKDNRRWEAISPNPIYSRLFLYGSLSDSLMKGNLKRFGVDILKNPNYQGVTDPYSNRKTIGLDAALNGNGFRVDGSYQYGLILSGKVPTYSDYDFSDTLSKIKLGTGRFIPTERVSQGRLNKLRELIVLLKSKDRKSVV